MPVIQPSLRDLGNTEFGPGVETPGYSRLSLRDKESEACVDDEQQRCQLMAVEIARLPGPKEYR